MAAEPKTIPHVSPQEYVARVRAAATKSEYYAGEIVAMAGASPAHNRISFDLGVALSNRLSDSRCEIFGPDQRVRVADAGPYTYPALSLACESPRFDLDECLLNPVVIVEVLSQSTESRDRGEKSFHYRRMPSLREYVLVSQDKMRIELYTRQNSNLWLLREFTEPDEVLTLESCGASVPLSEIYPRVNLTAPDVND